MKTADYNHVILYAKNWYKRGDIVEDLKRIFAERSMLYVEHVSDEDVWHNMTNVLMKYANSCEIERVLDDFFKPIGDEGPGFVFKFFEDNCPLHRAIRRIMSVLSMLKVLDNDKNRILDLGRPDPKILPLKAEDTLEKWDALQEKSETKE